VQSLGSGAVLSGVVLLCCLLALASIGARKRLSTLPIGSTRAWTNVHLYLGFFTTLVYVFHVPRLLVTGPFESALAGLFWTVTVSGFYGLYSSRTVPRRLTAIGGEYRFEQFAWHRAELLRRVKQLLTGAFPTLALEQATTPDQRDRDVELNPSDVLQSYFVQHLNPFFSRPRSWMYYLLPTMGRRRRLMKQLAERHRYLDEDSIRIASELSGLVRRRDELDYAHALQLRLRIWVVVHASLSTLLLLWAIAHALLAFQFLGDR
ncbi:MAG: hypothetical protein AAFP90_17450, partial [Planctomycetota bacterium]